MNDIITDSQSTEIVDPTLRKIAVRISRQLELAAQKVAANHAHPDRFPLASDPHSFERILATRFNTLSKAKKLAASAKAVQRIDAAATDRARRYGDLTAIDLRRADAIEAQALALPFPAELKLSADHIASLTELHGQILEPIANDSLIRTVAGVAGTTAVKAAAAKSSKLAFRIHKVKCLDETNDIFGGESGDDEILLGGATVDAVGTVAKVKSFLVRNDFDDGEQKVYSPPMTFAKFDLTKGEKFPKSYFVTTVMAEEDNGGFPEVLADISNAIKSAVGKALGTAAATLLGPALGAAIGAIVSAVLGWLFDAIKELWEDDVFPPNTVSIKIPSFNCGWNGKKDSPERTVYFKEFGGKYALTYDWQLLA